MAVIDRDTVSPEDGVELEDDEGAGGFDAVGEVHMVDTVCEELVRVQEALVGVHGGEVDALGDDDGQVGFDSRDGVAVLFGGVGAGVQVWDGADEGGADDGFEEG